MATGTEHQCACGHDVWGLPSYQARKRVTYRTNPGRPAPHLAVKSAAARKTRAARLDPAGRWSPTGMRSTRASARGSGRAARTALPPAGYPPRRPKVVRADPEGAHPLLRLAHRRPLPATAERFRIQKGAGAQGPAFRGPHAALEQDVSDTITRAEARQRLPRFELDFDGALQRFERELVTDTCQQG